jgi:GT2 family glycosyltransferase
MIHVIIPIYNRLKYTVACLKSIESQNNVEDLEIIVVDDGSSDGTKNFIKKNFSKVKIISGTGNLFWCGSVHLGIINVLKNCKGGDWILLVNNDIELSKDTITDLVNLSEKTGRNALVGSLTVSAYDRQTIIKSGTIVKSWFFNRTKHVYEGLKLNQIPNKDSIEVDLLTGRCLLHPVEMFEKVGHYDVKRFIHYGADDEFSFRVKNFGYSVLLCPTSIVYLQPNEIITTKTISLKSFFYTFFSIRSSSNIINKFHLTIKIAPFYAKITFFIIGVIKSFYIFLKK